MIEDSSRIMVVENFYKENNLPFVRRGGGGGGGGYGTTTERSTSKGDHSAQTHTTLSRLA